MSRRNAQEPIVDVEAFIVAGGRGRRFGGDKLLHPYRGKPLIQHAVDILQKIFARVSIVATGGERFSFLGVPWYPDMVEGVGPLAGIYTALAHSEKDRCFITGGDMPGLNADFIRHLADVSRNFDVTVPVVAGEYEALHAVYSMRCFDFIGRSIEAGERRIIGFYDKVRVHMIEEGEISRFAPPSRMFRNINFRGDLDDTPASG